MAKIDNAGKRPKKKARLAAIENGLAEIQRQLRELGVKFDAHAAHAHGDAPRAPDAALDERLARLETKLDALISELAQVEVGQALGGEARPGDVEPGSNEN